MTDDEDLQFSRNVTDNRKIDFWGPPVTDLPGWAMPFTADGFYIELYPPVEFEIAYKIPDYIIFAPYAHAVFDLSIQDGPVRRVYMPGGAVCFAAPETVVRARMEAPVEFLVLAAPPGRVEPIFDRVLKSRSWVPEVPTGYADPGLAALQLELRRSLLSDPLVQRPYMATLADGIFARIALGFGASEVTPEGRESLPPALLARLVDKIEAELNAGITVAALAREAGLSRSHFSRAFHSVTGHAPKEFIVARRISRARDLLAESDQPVSEIAVETGFYSPAHFAKVFKDRLGVGPSQYRKSFRARPPQSPE